MPVNSVYFVKMKLKIEKNVRLRTNTEMIILFIMETHFRERDAFHNTQTPYRINFMQQQGFHSRGYQGNTGDNDLYGYKYMAPHFYTRPLPIYTQQPHTTYYYKTGAYEYTQHARSCGRKAIITK